MCSLLTNEYSHSQSQSQFDLPTVDEHFSPMLNEIGIPFWFLLCFLGSNLCGSPVIVVVVADRFLNRLIAR